ncbi:MAG: LacI family DNA-binding transcriptional regulator [Paracoccaceae bacterium]|nr:LacI family DNA-binding transcriptional regulator [Paracoccaceae bacterium]
MKDVARQAGVSVASVSRALSRPNEVRPQTRDVVLEAVRQTGYRMNQAAADLRTGRSKTLLVLVSDITNAFFAEFFKGIEEEARKSGYVTLIGDTSEAIENERAFSDMLLLNQAGGLILNALGFPEDLKPTDGQSRYSGPPLVSCGGHGHLSVPVVRIDDEMGGRLAAQHLIDLGHSDITQVCGPLNAKSLERRYDGFNAALRIAGLPVQTDRFLHGPLSTEFGLQAAQTLLDRPALPTAIFAHNDEVAVSLMHGLANAGVRIPDDVSVVGYDDMPYAAVFNPGLTTVSLPRREWGRRACQKLMSILEGHPATDDQQIIKPQFIARASSGRART